MGGGTGLKALVLLSGGLDSTTVLSHALSKGYDVTCLSFDYGQALHRQKAPFSSHSGGILTFFLIVSAMYFAISSLDVCFTSHMKTNSSGMTISYRTTASAGGFMAMIMPSTSRYQGNL